MTATTSVPAPELLFRWRCRHCGMSWWTERPALLWWKKRAVTFCPFCGKPYRQHDDTPATAQGVTGA